MLGAGSAQYGDSGGKGSQAGERDERRVLSRGVGEDAYCRGTQDETKIATQTEESNRFASLPAQAEEEVASRAAAGDLASRVDEQGDAKPNRAWRD